MGLVILGPELGPVTAMWPAGAVAFAAVLAWGPWTLPFLAGAHTVGLLGMGLAAAPALALGGIAAAQAALAVGIARVLRFDARLMGTGDVLRLALAAGGAAATASALRAGILVGLGATTMEMGETWVFDTAADMLAILLLSPTLLLLPSRPQAISLRVRWPETAAYVALAFVVLSMTFGVGRQSPVQSTAFLLAPILALAAFRLGPGGVSLLLPIMTFFGVWGTVRGLGPLAPLGFLGIQGFLAIQGGLALMVAAAVASRRLAEAELRAEREQLAERVVERTAELERANKALAQRVKDLQAANDELDAFAHSASHDLRAPLRGMDAITSVLLEEESEKVSEQARAGLIRLREEARHMGDLVDGLTRLSRIASADLEPRSVDVSAMAHAVWRDLRAGDDAREVRFHVEPDIRVRGDAPLLRVALTNLLANAWKYTALADSPRVEVVKEEYGFSVRDNGIGFDPKRSREIFSPFRRLPEARRFDGTGVGLTTVRRIVERHGGEVRAEGRPGEGATFTVILPEDGPTG